MPVLHLTLKDGARHIPSAPGLSGRAIFDIIDIKVHSPGGGVGACGLGRARIEAGNGSSPTLQELTHLYPHQMQWGIRLSLWDQKQWRRLAGRFGLNPQAREISRLARETIGEVLQKIGTNSESALLDSKVFWVIAVARVLAFEGWGLRGKVK
jgi:hypothetical protein